MADRPTDVIKANALIEAAMLKAGIISDGRSEKRGSALTSYVAVPNRRHVGAARTVLENLAGISRVSQNSAGQLVVKW